MTRRVLVTGGFGYLGGRIAVELAADGSYTLRLGSRKPRASPEWLPEAETALVDVLKSKSLRAALDGAKDVVHLAAMNEIECASDPGKALLINTLGTLHTLQASIDAGVERFIYFSTAHIYGTPLVGHVTEKTVPRPMHPYAITHLSAEQFVLAAHDQRKILGIVIRLSNGYGAPTHPGVDRWTLLVNDLCRQAVHDRKMVLRSDGLQYRDFIALKDVGRAVTHVLGLDETRLGDGLFNLGGEKTLQVWDVVQEISSRCQTSLGFTPNIERIVSTRETNPPSLRYDCQKLFATGFKLVGSMEQEIDNTLALCWQSTPVRN